jgi:lysophospholipase L1-like esterase
MPFGWLLLASPPLAYLGWLALDTVREGYLIFGKLDLIVLMVSVGYLALVLPLVRTRRQAVAVLVVVGGSLASLFAANEFASRWIPKPRVDAYPWPPMKRTRDIGPAIVGVQGPADFSINSWGIRGPELESIDPANSILCVGGSTTECLYITDQRSWPWRTGDILSQKLARPIFVGNAGRSGHLVKHHQYLIEHYPAIDHFGWVVVLAGINDLGCLLHGNREQRESNVASETLFRWTRPHEASYRRLTLWRLMESVLDIGTPVASGQIVQDPAGRWIDLKRAERANKRRADPHADERLTVGDDPQIYRRRLVSLVEACRRRNLKLLLATQPTMWRADLSTQDETLLVEQTANGAYSAGFLAQLMATYNEILISVGQETGTPVADLAGAIPKDRSAFYDDCHFNDAGCEKVAQVLAERLAAEMSSIPQPHE